MQLGIRLLSPPFLLAVTTAIPVTTKAAPTTLTPTTTAAGTSGFACCQVMSSVCNVSIRSILCM